MQLKYGLSKIFNYNPSKGKPEETLRHEEDRKRVKTDNYKECLERNRLICFSHIKHMKIHQMIVSLKQYKYNLNNRELWEGQKHKSKVGRQCR